MSHFKMRERNLMQSRCRSICQRCFLLPKMNREELLIALV